MPTAIWLFDGARFSPGRPDQPYHYRNPLTFNFCFVTNPNPFRSVLWSWSCSLHRPIRLIEFYCKQKSACMCDSLLLCDLSWQVDLDNTDGKEYPETAALEFVDCVLEEGDLLYIPPKWWHYVISLSISFSVSFRWRTSQLPWGNLITMVLTNLIVRPRCSNHPIGRDLIRRLHWAEPMHVSWSKCCVRSPH